MNGLGAVTPPEVKVINPQSCMLSWIQPTEKGRFPIQGFYVEQIRLDSFGWVRLNDTPIDSTFYLVPDLVPGRKYRFRITVENSKGTVREGIESKIIETFGRPDSPSELKVYDVTHRSCMLQWMPPESNGGTPITKYRIEIKTGDSSVWRTNSSVDGTEFSKKICGLQEHCKYKFQIKALNKVHTSLPSSASQTITAKGNDVTDGKDLVQFDDEMLESLGLMSVSESFNRGLENLVSIVELIQSQKLTISYLEAEKLSIEIHVSTALAYANMQNAFTKIEAVNNELNKRIECLAKEQGQKESNLREKEAEIKKICTEIKEMQKQLRKLREEKLKAEAEFINAEKALKEAEEQLRRQKRKRKKARGIGGLVTAAVSIVSPLAGIIVGGIAVAANMSIEDCVKHARTARDAAEKNRDSQRQRVEEKKEDITRSQAELADRESERNTIKSEIEKLKAKIQCLRRKMARQTDISLKIKACYRYVSSAADRAEILYDQVKFLCDTSAIHRITQDLAEQLSLPDATKLGLLLNKHDLSVFVLKAKMTIDADQNWRHVDLLNHEKELQVFMGTKSGKSVVETVAKTDNILRSISSQKDSLKDAELIMSQYAGWEQCLSPAPMTVAFLGELIRLSMIKDFPLDCMKMKDGFKYLRSPESFRASIIQIVNEGWSAFNTAQRNMEQIHIYMKEIPNHLNTAFNIIACGSNEEIEHFLHLPLDAVKLISEKCLQKAKQADCGFAAIMKIIAELQEACVATKGLYEHQVNKKRTLLQVGREEEALIKEERKHIESMQIQFQETINEAEKKFEEAMFSLPDGWSIFGMTVVDAICTGAVASLNVISKPFRSASKRSHPEKKNSESDVNTDNLETSTRKNIRQVYEQASILKNLIDCLVLQFVEGEELKFKEVQNSNKMFYCESQIQLITTRLKNVDEVPARKQIEHLCARSISVCKQLGTERNSFSVNKTSSTFLTKAILLVQHDVNTLVSNVSVLLGSKSEGKSLNRTSWQLRNDTGKGAVEYELRKARAKIQQTSSQLEHTQKKYDEVCKRLQESGSWLTALLGVMAKVDMEKCNFEDILDLLKCGLKELGQLRQSWGRIVHIFGTIPNVLDCTLNVSLKKFGDISRTISTLHRTNDGYNISHFRRDMLYYQVCHASEMANFVANIADCYTEVSKKYLMTSIETLIPLIKFDPAAEDQELQNRLQQLRRSCKNSQMEIVRLIEQKRTSMQNSINARISKLEEASRQQLAMLEKVRKDKDVTSDTNGELNMLDVDDFI